MTFFFGRKDTERSALDLLLNKKKLECVILIGDSILDTFYWIENHASDVEHELRALLEGKIKIVNLAMDAFNIDGVLNGMKPSPAFVTARETFGLSPYELDTDDGQLHPIRILSRMIMDSDIQVQIKKQRAKKWDKNQINPTVILSLMNNDIRRNLKYGRSELIIESMRNEQFGHEYEKIIKLLTHNLQLNVIIVLSFEPHESFTEDELHFGRDDLLAVWDFCVCKILQIAEEYSCAVIDLSRTLNPFDRAHYGSTPIEFSDLSQKFLIELILEVLARFEFASNDFEDTYNVSSPANSSSKIRSHTIDHQQPSSEKNSNRNRKNSYFAGGSSNSNESLKTSSIIYHGIPIGVTDESNSGFTAKPKKKLLTSPRSNGKKRKEALPKGLNIRTDTNNRKFRSKYFSLLQNRAPQATDISSLLFDIAQDFEENK